MSISNSVGRSEPPMSSANSQVVFIAPRYRPERVSKRSASTVAERGLLAVPAGCQKEVSPAMHRASCGAPRTVPAGWQCVRPGLTPYTGWRSMGVKLLPLSSDVNTLPMMPIGALVASPSICVECESSSRPGPSHASVFAYHTNSPL